MDNWSVARWSSILTAVVCVTGVSDVLCAADTLERPDALVLVEGGAAKATIVIGDHADSWTRMAAGWVQQYVAKSSGASLPIVSESKAPQGTLISVGPTRLAAQAGVTADDLKYDGCR